MDSQTLAASIRSTQAAMNRYDSVAEALTAARAAAGSDDRILVFGSFVTVAEAMRDLQRSGQQLEPRGSKSE